MTISKMYADWVGKLKDPAKDASKFYTDLEKLIDFYMKAPQISQKEQGEQNAST